MWIFNLILFSLLIYLTKGNIINILQTNTNVHNEHISNEDERISGKNGWYVPNIDGTLNWIDLYEAERYLYEMKELESRLFSLNPVVFYLYTREEPNKYKIIKPTKHSINSSRFNATNPTYVIIHGWNSDKDAYVNTGIRDALLENFDYNIIVIDWSRARSITYVSSVVAIPQVGEKISKLLEFLIENFGLKLSDITIVGHSLGAHVAGFVGKSISVGKILAIIGLDPALPFFKHSDAVNRLNSTDAGYVETIHTNGGKLGFLEPIGQCSFYPNGGISQPGCGVDLLGSCAHKRAVIYYVEAIKEDNFVAINCSTYEHATNKKCGSTLTNERMGTKENAFKEQLTGVYYVPINKKSPYGKA